MKARFINEIVKGKVSGIEALGIGKASMNRGYKKMVELYSGLEERAWTIKDFDEFTAYDSYFGSDDENKTFKVELSKDEMEDISMISKVPLKELLYINPEMHAGFNSDYAFGSLEEMTKYLGDNLVNIELETKDPNRRLETINKVAKFRFVWWEDFQFGYLLMAEGTWVFLVFRNPDL